MSEQGQLWNAGAVRTPSKRGRPRLGQRVSAEGPSHKRKYHICREPGCEKPPRNVQGATYCEEHARAKDYKANGLNPEMAFKKQAQCLGCGKSYRRLRMKARSGARDACNLVVGLMEAGGDLRAYGNAVVAYVETSVS